MEAKAHLKYARMSPRKMQGIANLVRGKSVNEALAILVHLDKKAAKILRRVLLSAVSNAEHRGVSDVDQLSVQQCHIDCGPIIKRWMPRAMGRANRIQRRTSHISVVVA